ncbi:cytochrome P450 [Coniochaeta sp. 2T2.1]|nr:cytochrome P450 [Coniochaeta sp. 2T2.1]
MDREDVGSLKLVAWITVGLFVFFAVKFVYQAIYNILFHPLSGVPGPRVAAILSSYLSPALFRGDRAQTLLALHNTYGPVVRVGPNEVSISDWRAYRQIYTNKASRKEESFYKAAKFIAHENIFTMRNKAEHSARRKLQSQPYSQTAVFENESLIASRATILVDRAISGAETSASGRTVDMYTLCGLFSLEVILQCAFNHDSGERADGDSLEYLHMMDASAKLLPINAAMPWILKLGIGAHLPGGLGQRYRGHARWAQMTDTFLADFQANDRAYDKSQRFLSTPLLVNHDEFLGRRLSRSEALEEAMGIAFAGSGTTSTTLFYLIYAMSRPEAEIKQELLRQEINAAAKNGKLGLKDIQGVPYLNAVIKETMRLYPTIISTLPRTLETSVTISPSSSHSGLKTAVCLPAGTDVGMQNYVHHRDPSVFPDPHTFNPERWLSSDEAELKDMEAALTPFSLGPRMCIGQNLAKAELYLAVTEIFRRLKVRLNEAVMKPEDMIMEDRFNIAPRGRKLVVDIEVIGSKLG